MPLQPAEVIAVRPFARNTVAASGELADASKTQPQEVTLRIARKSSCAACAAGVGCGVGLFSRLLASPTQEFVLESSLALAPGDRVWLAASPAAVERMALLWYGLPLLLMLLLAGVTQWLFLLAQWTARPWLDLAVLLALLVGLAAGWRLARRWSLLTTAKVTIVRQCKEQHQQPHSGLAIEENPAGTNIACKLVPHDQTDSA